MRGRMTRMKKSKKQGRKFSGTARDFQVEKVLNLRVNNGTTEYLIKWEGFPREQATWETEKTLGKVKHLLRDYTKGHKTSTSPRKLRARPEASHQSKFQAHVIAITQEPHTSTRQPTRTITLKSRITGSNKEKSRKRRDVGHESLGSKKAEGRDRTIVHKTLKRILTRRKTTQKPQASPVGEKEAQQQMKIRTTRKRKKSTKSREAKEDEEVTHSKDVVRARKRSHEDQARTECQTPRQNEELPPPKKILCCTKEKKGQGLDYVVEWDQVDPGGRVTAHCNTDLLAKHWPRMLIDFLEKHVSFRKGRQSHSPK